MAVTVLFQVTVGGVNGSCSIVLDYDSVAQNIGVTVTGTGKPVLTQCAMISPRKSVSGLPMSLASLLGQGRTVLLKNVTTTEVLKFDGDLVPTNLNIGIDWNP